MSLLEKITDEELELYELLVHPQSYTEIMFSDMDNLALFNEKQVEVRMGQLSMLNYSYIVDDEDPNLTRKENFKNMERAGTVYNIGARKFGKTLISLVTDMLCAVMHYNFDCIYSSYDYFHVTNVLDDVGFSLSNHSILRDFKLTIAKKPNYLIRTKTGFTINGINANVLGGNAGDNYYGLHCRVVWQDEISKESQEVFEKRVESTHELGCIERFCVAENSDILMSDFTTKKIQNIKSGDNIITWNDKKSCLEETIVKNKFNSGIRDVINISNSRNNLWVTPEHKIFAKRKNHCLWVEAQRAEVEDLSTEVFSYIKNKRKYEQGVLLGLMDSDGYCQKTQCTYGDSFQFKLYQSESCEYEYIKKLFKKLKITYGEDIQKDNFNDGCKRSPCHVFRIKKENNDFILKLYNDLELNRDIQFGYLAGFVLGDGHLATSSCLEISQNSIINFICWAMFGHISHT